VNLKILPILLAGTLSLSYAEDCLNLPDPLLTHSGKTVDTTKVWEEVRRAEILELFRTHVYGRAPIGRPENVIIKLLETDDKALNGVATRKQIRVHLSGEIRGINMDLLIYLPKEQPRPVKLFLGLNFIGNHTIHQDEAIFKTDQYTPWGEGERARCSRRWPLDDILRRGYGVATIHCADLDTDKPDDFKDGVHGAFDPSNGQTGRPDDAWGSIGAWAWGLSRAMDYFETGWLELQSTSHVHAEFYFL
jgi:hypothetical protein